MQELKIERGIPVPMRNQTKMTTTIRNMAIGDSFLMPKDEARHTNPYSVAKRIGFKVSARTDKGNRRMMRVWRIA